MDKLKGSIQIEDIFMDKLKGNIMDKLKGKIMDKLNGNIMGKLKGNIKLEDIIMSKFKTKFMGKTRRLNNKFMKKKKLRRSKPLHNLLRLPGNASKDSGQV